MAIPHIPTYKEINYVIRRTFPDIPSQVDDEGFILADGISLTKNTYDPANGNYELHVRDKKNNKWKSFDTEDNPNCLEDAAKCFVEFYYATHKPGTSLPEPEIIKVRYMLERIRSILAEHHANLDAVPGGLTLRDGEPGPDTVAFTLVTKEVE